MVANAVFVAPFLMESTLRFVDAAASLPGVRLGLVSQDAEESLPPGLRSKLDGHYRIDDGMDPEQIKLGVGALGRHFGGVDRILGSLEQLQVPLGMVRDALGVQGMGTDAAVNFRDKSRMKTVLSQHGLPCARHRLAHSADEAITFADEVGFPLVVKPPAGAGTIDTFRINSADELRRWLGVAPPNPDRPAQVEEFLTGEEFSFDSVYLDGRVVWHNISRYLPTPLEAVDNPWIQFVVVLPRDIDGPEYDAIRQVGPAALHALGMTNGLAHMEWFRRPDGSAAVSEVGARPPGALITPLMSWAHERDFYSEWARLMIFDTFDPPERRFAAGAAFLRGQGEGRIRAVHGLEEMQREVGELVVEARLPKEGAVPATSYEGDGYVIVRHPDTSVVEWAVRRMIETIRVELG
ncbi:MAG TPA: hypothetical protein VMY88_13085 [Acidimicrobiales bacterium]|nr:hypothetical protein [Acidimicrobiales bacterium]